MNNKTTLKYSLISLYIFVLFIPAITLFRNTPDESVTTLPQLTYLLMRVAGLYAIVFLFFQVLIGAFIDKLRLLFGTKILQVHIVQGTVSLLVIITHPLMFFLLNFQTSSFVSSIFLLSPRFSTVVEKYESFGKIAFLLLMIAILAGLFRKNKYIKKHWRKFHYLNYVAFAFVIVHSYFLGSDSRIAPFVFLYPLFVSALVVAVVYRRVYRVFMAKKIKKEKQPSKNILLGKIKKA